MLKSPSEWLVYCLSQISYKKNSHALDLACGYGRNSIYLEDRGYKVISIDISKKALDDFSGKNITKICKNIEDINSWPVHEKKFEIVLVTNFLNREIFSYILKSVNKGGYLIYETFSEGNEKYGKPKNKDFILKSKELLKLTEEFKLLCYENVKVEFNNSGFVKQKILAKNV